MHLVVLGSQMRPFSQEISTHALALQVPLLQYIRSGHSVLAQGLGLHAPSTQDSSSLQVTLAQLLMQSPSRQNWPAGHDLPLQGSSMHLEPLQILSPAQPWL